MVQQTKRACLQCVLQDDVSGLVKIVNATNGLTDLDCLIDKKYPLAEARSVEMLILLSHLKGNIYQQLPDGKRIFYQNYLRSRQ